MSEEIKLSVEQASTHDAQLIAVNVEEGKEKTPNVNLDADYQAAQQLSNNRNAQTEAGKKALEETLAPKFKVTEPEEKEVETQATGNPEDYMKMADEISPLPDAAGNVSDELMAKALEMGKPGQ
jgi:CHASE1-domain containing sensor protein